MKKTLLLLLTAGILHACNQKDKDNTPARNDKKAPPPEYLVTKDGIGDLKIEMTQAEIEKLLGQALQLKHARDTGEIWADTALAKYRDIEVSLYFERQYNEDPTIKVMQLIALGSSSPRCRTADGLGVGDSRADILAAYEDNPINMGPENVMINDTTWALSKTNYYINISDDKWDKQIIFLLVNKKVASVQASLAMGD